MSIERYESNEKMSQVSKVNNLIILAGQVSEGNDIKSQAKSVFKQIDDLLKKSGSSVSKILYANIFLTNMDDYTQFNQVWGEWIDHRSPPSRAAIQVVQLANPSWKVEVQVFATV